MSLVFAVINFILFRCGYSTISDEMWQDLHQMNNQMRIVVCLRKNKVLSPNDRIYNFMKRRDVREAFEVAVRIYGLNRENTAQEIGLPLN